MTSKHKHIPEEAMSEPRNPTSMLNITNDQCKYPLGDELARAELFCGKPCFDNFSYCAWHYIIAHDIKK